MGSEGYLLNQFMSRHVNQRQDRWGGTLENRMRFSLEIVKAIREAVGRNLLSVFVYQCWIWLITVIPWMKSSRLPGVRKAGVTLLNTGIGWHEARIPTIVTSVPRAAFVDYTAEVKQYVNIPVIASNRINMPETAETILAEGKADMVQMARPFLADPFG